MDVLSLDADIRVILNAATLCYFYDISWYWELFDYGVLVWQFVHLEQIDYDLQY